MTLLIIKKVSCCFLTTAPQLRFPCFLLFLSLILSYLILSYLILSYLILSYLNRSSPALILTALLLMLLLPSASQEEEAGRKRRRPCFLLLSAPLPLVACGASACFPCFASLWFSSCEEAGNSRGKGSCFFFLLFCCFSSFPSMLSKHPASSFPPAEEEAEGIRNREQTGSRKCLLLRSKVSGAGKKQGAGTAEMQEQGTAATQRGSQNFECYAYHNLTLFLLLAG
uniref:hypothetical protein 6 n=1 Tax=Moniliophthora perniciosa TaxID=153609 RepID=UPI0000242339|nr:hypothetical protein 6 [Moniliophthora perniciosa]AAQ74296.1 hypothetical protein 6 [Moniliophthora perniciosa]